MPDRSAAITPDGFRVSIVIPCLNEEKAIGRCLDSLVAQNFPRDGFEVIVVDNGSTDGTLDIVRTYSTALHLTILSESSARVSGLRNMGAAKAGGEMLAFLDGDCLPRPTWLSRSVELLSADGCGVIGGYYSIPADSSWVAKAWWDGKASEKKKGAVSYIPTSDLLVSRSNFVKIGGFDETLETNEDCEFAQRASRAGLTIMAFPELGVVHLGSPQTLRAFYRRERWHGTDVFRVFLRNISTFSNGKAVLFAFYFAFCLIALGLGCWQAIDRGQFGLLSVSLFALIIAPLSLGVWKASQLDKWSDLFPITFLYFVYGIARARCLLDLGGSARRKRTPDR